MKGSFNWKGTFFKIDLIVLLLLFCWNTHITGQSCDYTTGSVSLTVSGGNQTDQYRTVYVLATTHGVILEINENDPTFEISIEGFYVAYAINLKEEATLSGLQVNNNIDQVSADDCFDVGPPFGFTVCRELSVCNYCLGETVSLESDGGNNSGQFTTKYVITDNNGRILRITDIPEFEDLEIGLYLAFAVNYESDKAIIGLDTFLNITNVQSGCLDISAPYIIGICDQLQPTIFFDLKGCDITQTAILQVGEVFNSYLWNTGSTASFIEVSATTRATYSVTVTLDNGCKGIKTQTITGNEISRLGDFVWEDIDADGRQDANEVGINGVRVNLYADFDRNGQPDFAGFPSCTTVTANHPETGQPGYYQFTLYQSNYVVQFVAPSGFVATERDEGDEAKDSDINNNGFTATIAVGNGVTINNVDAGFRTSSRICGLIWEDEDGDGRRDPLETGVNSVQLNLYTLDGELAATTISLTDPATDTPGTYCFDNLPVKEYYIEIELPDGRTLAVPNVGNDDTVDSDATGTYGFGTTDIIVTSPGNTNGNVDFGIYIGGVICGIVWKENEQGTEAIYDEGIDSGIANSQVELVDANTNERILIGVTGSDGRYCINSIPVGSYKVLFRASTSGESYVQRGQGNNPLLDSDVDINTGMTGVFFVPPADTISGINAGLRLEALPIELLSFSGYRDLKSNEIKLEWTTASEINNDYFEIERNINFKGSFEVVGRVDGNGTTTNITTYKYSDTDLKKSGTYYYRLKQIDYDGGFEYSNMIAIDVILNDQASLKIYPNPVKESTKVEIITSGKGHAEISLTDLMGREIRSSTSHLLYNGSNIISIPCNDLANGSYLLAVRIGSSLQYELIQVAR